MVLLDSLRHMRTLYRVRRREVGQLKNFQQIRHYSSNNTPELTNIDSSEGAAETEVKDTPAQAKSEDSSSTQTPSEENAKFAPIRWVTRIHAPENLQNGFNNDANHYSPRRTPIIHGAASSRNNIHESAPRFSIRWTPSSGEKNTPRYGIWRFNPKTDAFESRSPNYDQEFGQGEVNIGDHDSNDYEKSKELSHDYKENNGEMIFSGLSEDSLNLDEGRHEQVSTITAGEKTAFQKIFKEIFEKKRWDRTVSVYGEPFSQQLDPEEKRRRQRKTDDQIDEIISESVYRHPKTIEEVKKELERYPPAIRATAAEAFGLDILEAENKKIDDQDSASDEAVSRANPFGDAQYLKKQQQARELERQLEVVRESERSRVEALMRAATTDFDLWKVLEDEVFSLVQKMGLEDKPRKPDSLPSLLPKKRKSKKARSPNSQSSDLAEKSPGETEPETSPPKETEISPQKPSPDPLAAANGVSPLRLYGPLYPSYLLLGLRLLDRSFSRPSALALSLLPKIKSLGYISRVLGASTQFYNELLLILHFRHNDFQGMLRLLEEMELSSLVMNQETLEIIIQVSRSQDRVRQGAQGLGISSLWALPNFARGKFNPWRDYLRETLEPRPDNRIKYQVGNIAPHPKRMNL